MYGMVCVLFYFIVLMTTVAFIVCFDIVQCEEAPFP